MKKLTLLLLVWVIGLQSALASSLDQTFNIGSGANGIVEQVLPLSNGKILICGNFTSFNGQPRAYIARLNNDGSVDTSFQAQASYWVRNMSVQSDGKIVIGGYFKSVGGQPRSLIARLNADGSLDSSFNPGLGAHDIIAGGIDGNVDPFVFWTAVQPDGKILITGNFKNYNGTGSVGIARINPDGSRDTSFNVGGGLNSWGRHILVMPNGQILVSGWFTWYNNKSANRLVRINANGSPDMSFNPFFGDKTAIYSTALVANNKIIAAGHSLNEEGLFKREMARLNPDGSFDETFVGKTNEKTESVAVQPDGKVIVVGNFSSVNDQPQKCLARFHPDGQIDTSLRANIDNFVWGAALQADGKLLISGGFWTVDGQSRPGVARLHTGVVPGTLPDPAPVLSAAAVSTSAINISWTDASTTRTGYTVERKNGSNGTYASIGNVSASTRAFADSGLLAGTSYYYRLRAGTSSGGDTYSNDANATTQSAGGTTGTSGATVTFVTQDSTTQGSWKGTYGADGHVVIGEATRLPGYISAVTPSGKSDWTWQFSTSEARALQKANSTDRLLACWYSGGQFSINVNSTDANAHRLALYFVDADNAGRTQKIEIWDGSSGALLNTQTVSGFGGGKWLVYDVKGSIRITIAKTAGINGVISGIFFGGGGAPAPTVATPGISPAGGTFSGPVNVSLSMSTPSTQIRYTLDGSNPTSTSALYAGPFTLSSSATVKARGFRTGYNPSGIASATFTITTTGGGGGSNFRFLGNDSSTKGNWSSKFGAQGYQIPRKSAQNPSYGSASFVGQSDWTWNDPTSDIRALIYPAGSSRIASCWFAASSFRADVNFTDGSAHKISAYFLDWDNAGRVQTVELVNSTTGAVLHSTTLSNFSGGVYLSWDVKGPVSVRLTRVSGPNAVMNGFFFDAPSAAL